MLPNSHIPIVLNPKFEFVPFESNAHKQTGDPYAQHDNGPNTQAIDMHKLTPVQTREPPNEVSDYLRLDESKNGINLMQEGDKKELINFLMTKIFCVS